MEHPLHIASYDWQPLSQDFLIANYSKRNVGPETTITQ